MIMPHDHERPAVSRCTGSLPRIGQTTAFIRIADMRTHSARQGTSGFRMVHAGTFEVQRWKMVQVLGRHISGGNTGLGLRRAPEGFTVQEGVSGTAIKTTESAADRAYPGQQGRDGGRVGRLDRHYGSGNIRYGRGRRLDPGRLSHPFLQIVREVASAFQGQRHLAKRALRHYRDGEGVGRRLA